MGQSVDVVVSELLSAATRLEDAGQRLRDGLSSVDLDVGQLLGGDWKGGAASAYAPVWETWHDGAAQVVRGLQRMSELLTIAGKEYAKTDESASGALDSTMPGSGGPAGSGGGGASGGGGGGGAGQATGSPEDSQQAMAAAMQLGQVAGQPLSQVGQGATGLAQTIAALAQQAAQLADEAVQPADSVPTERTDGPRTAERPGD